MVAMYSFFSSCNQSNKYIIHESIYICYESIYYSYKIYNFTFNGSNYVKIYIAEIISAIHK